MHARACVGQPTNGKKGLNVKTQDSLYARYMISENIVLSRNVRYDKTRAFRKCIITGIPPFVLPEMLHCTSNGRHVLVSDPSPRGATLSPSMCQRHVDGEMTAVSFFFLATIVEKTI